MISRLLKLDEAADELRISKKTLRALIARGSIPGITVGTGMLRKRRVIQDTDLRRFIEGQRELALPIRPPVSKRRWSDASASPSAVSGFRALREQRIAARQEVLEKRRQRGTKT